MDLSERLGLSFGYALGVFTASLSFLRRSRMFHPRGLIFSAQVTPLQTTPFSQSFEGEALMRFSSAWWKQKEWRDVLGIAIRIHSQDLLFATIEYPWTLPIAPFLTQYHDFLKNNFYGVSPFSIPTGEKVKIRLAPKPTAFEVKNLTRRERINQAVKNGSAIFELQTSPLQKTLWTAIAEVRVVKEITIDQASLRFSPFENNGLNLRPRGFVHHLRIGAYQLSQFGRGLKSS